ncbi:MAG: hypothetical protein K2L82_17175 [Lachnospiraceae bacterium]|nr:hypothetical protein [Lachnospiraceae bacterium]
MKKKSLGMAIVIFAVLAIALLILFGGISGRKPYEMGNSSGTERFLLDDSNMGEMTDADKMSKYIDYLESVLEDDIVESYPDIKSVKITLPETEDITQVEISLGPEGSLAEENLTEIANVVATAVGSSTTEDIVIQDTEGRILFMKNTPKPEG